MPSEHRKVVKVARTKNMALPGNNHKKGEHVLGVHFHRKRGQLFCENISWHRKAKITLSSDFYFHCHCDVKEIHTFKITLEKYITFAHLTFKAPSIYTLKDSL